MQGNIQTRPCRSAARAFIAGAAFLAGAAIPFATPAQAQDTPDDTAMVIPRPGSGGAPMLPRPLSAQTAGRLRQAFRQTATSLDLGPDALLHGHVLAARLLATPTRAEPDELYDWLRRFPDLPDATLIHDLLRLRLAARPTAAPPSAAPSSPALPPAPSLPALPAPPPGDDVETSDSLLPRNPALDRTVRDAASAGQFDRALKLIERTRGLSAEYAALLRAEVARAMFSQGRDLDALALAATAHAEARGTVGLAAWIGGLAAWRLGRFETARIWFEDAWRARLNAPGQKAAAAYWAARASLVTRGEHGPWMHRASDDPRTFYGLLARRALDRPIDPTPAAFDRDVLAQADIDAIAATARGWRAFALLQVDQPARAAAELRLLFAETRDQPGIGRSILLVARTAGLNDLVAQLAAIMQPGAVRLPAAQLRPAGGFRFDPALVYALTRIESNFDSAAVSPAGAQGLMQLMPNAAQVAGGGTATPRLADPAVNLQAGQQYLLHLAALDGIGTDLIRLLAAYNAGPGNVARWLDVMRQEHDPLVFIEALPGEHTRAYVRRALAYSWLYAAQFGLPSTSRDALSVGLWPRMEIRLARRDPAARLH